MNETEIQHALAPLQPLLTDETISEIMVDALDRVLVERNRQVVETNIKFESIESLRQTIDAALALGGVAFKSGQTSAEARLPDGSRVFAVLPPTAVGDSPYLVIRKFWKTTLTMDKLIELGALTREAHQLIQSAIRARQNILVAGGTASGKTTLLNLLTDEIPADERVITVEASFELHVRHPRAISLAADSSSDMSYSDLISLASKLRPDRLIFGELRGAEVMRILDIISVGHDGAAMTIHANSTEDALSRLEAMGLMANLGLGLSEIRMMIVNALNVIIVQMLQPNGSRRITYIGELRGLDNDHYVLQPLMRYNPDTDRLEATNAQPRWQS